MIHPDLSGVRTLIFDMDGTLIHSGRIALRALRNGIAKFYTSLKLEVPDYTDEQLLSGIGAPSDVFYRGLLDKDNIERWREFREIIITEEEKLLNVERITFPGAINTLKTLKRRGYHLALVSNCGSPYLQAVLETQNLREYFETAVCIGDREGSTKTELVQEIAQQSGQRTAVIGDREYDVEAALANDLPAVGALYGYGSREELMMTATWVDDVRDLLHIFNPVRELAARIAAEVNIRRPLDRPFVLAIDTPHEALTFPLVQHVFQELTDLNVSAKHLRMEDYAAVHDHRDYPPDRWIREVYPWETLANNVLNKRNAGKIETSLTLVRDTETANTGDEVPVRMHPGSVLVVDGSFLLGDWAGGTYDYIVHVDARPDVISRLLRSSNTLNNHAKLTGALSVPFTLRNPESEAGEWKDVRRTRHEFYEKTLLENPSMELDLIVDGNNLQQGNLIRQKKTDRYLEAAG